jgi:hypothetical protein
MAGRLPAAAASKGKGIEERWVGGSVVGSVCSEAKHAAAVLQEPAGAGECRCRAPQPTQLHTNPCVYQLPTDPVRSRLFSLMGCGACGVCRHGYRVIGNWLGSARSISRSV